jgi:Flp pilus assembly protein TadG
MSRTRKSLLARFAFGSGGNVAPIFALSMIPMIGCIGAAIDYSSANSVKSSMQAALDATALQLSQTAATMTTPQLQTAAVNGFNALFTRSDAKDVKISATYTKTTGSGSSDGSSGSGSGSSGGSASTAGSTLTLSGSATVPTRFMRIVGLPQTQVATSTTVNWGTGRLRVALVLDNTGSMSDAGKISALKTATKGLLSQLQDTATVPEDVYVSIVPFSRDVNVGAANYSASWVDWTEWESNNGRNVGTTTCDNRGHGRGNDCTTTYAWVPDDHSTWNGCVGDRGTSSGPSSQNYDQKADVPVQGKPESLFPADQYDSCPLQMMGLNNNWSGMNSLVDQMYPAGTTNQPIGLVWGWQSLIGGGPLTVPVLDPKYQYQQVIILLSDGLNTQNRWNGNGSSVAPQVDARMFKQSDGAGTCQNIKNAGITIYTVHVNTDGDPLSKLLQNCASDPDKFIMLTSANQMVSTFQQIGTKLAKLRIAK